MSEIKVNKISPRANCGTVQLGDSGDTITIPAGATITNNGTQTGFGRTGTVDWQTSIKSSATFSASNGEGYFVDTSSNTVTANLPAGSVGAIVAFKDYAQNFGTNKLTISANGSDKIDGGAFDLLLDTDGLAVTLVFGDSTKGWQAVNSNEITNVQKFVTATGGTESTVCTNFKVHVFTGPGTFCVSCAGSSSGSNTVDYLVVGAGGGGGNRYAGGGGAGGYRFSNGTASGCYTAGPSPLGASALPVTINAYPITVGGGGAGAANNPGPATQTGVPGNTAVFSSITSTGGGGGGGHTPPGPGTLQGRPGGSGGGGGNRECAAGAGNAGNGNTPSVSPPQGNDGGTGYHDAAIYANGGGGGGASAVGGSIPTSAPTFTNPAIGAGGAGLTSCITGSPVARGGGGGGGAHPNRTPGAPGGTGGGGAGSPGSPATGTAGTCNTGGGGGGGGGASGVGGAGGSAVVIIRYKFQ